MATMESPVPNCGENTCIEGQKELSGYREKHWVECSDAEKIERLRNHLEWLMKENRRLWEDVQKLLYHGHDPLGIGLTVPMNIARDPQYEQLWRYKEIDKKAK